MATSNLTDKIGGQIDAGPRGRVWTPADFTHLGNRDAVDKILQRMVKAGQLRRIERGLYDRPHPSSLTKKPTRPDYREILDALVRRDQIRVLVDGMTAANDLGLTDAVPARVVVHTDARRRSIRVDNLTIEFKQTAPSKLYWAGRPAMRVVQALHWLGDTTHLDRHRIVGRLAKILTDPKYGPSIRTDLEHGYPALPIWMHPIVKELVGANAGTEPSRDDRDDDPSDDRDHDQDRARDDQHDDGRKGSSETRRRRSRRGMK